MRILNDARMWRTPKTLAGRRGQLCATAQASVLLPSLGLSVAGRSVQAEYMSLQEAAVLYSVSVDLLRKRISCGDLPAVFAGRRLIRVRLEDLKRVFQPVPAQDRRGRMTW